MLEFGGTLDFSIGKISFFQLDSVSESFSVSLSAKNSTHLTFLSYFLYSTKIFVILRVRGDTQKFYLY